MEKKIFSCLKSKKADMITDSLTFIIVLTALGLLIILIHPVFSQFNDEIQAGDDFDAVAKQQIDNTISGYPSLFDNLFVLAVVLLIVFVLVSSYFIDAHPIFFVISFIFLIIIFIVGGQLSNINEEILSDSEINAGSSFPKTFYIMTHLPQVVLLMMVFSGIIIYAKSRG
jgi:cytochrome bd-type quinol oxidase subunit 2